ncbi:MAG: type II secretion system protein GspG [Candidatus Scalindua sp. AMX11]|nr:MAG: type II secretion system protein GspG [Candidatus Scalindua sp.]NOG85256.1 type II secretion system major pseudopilin GspG [Planctomycetota bacterium]RZV81532.1 MAG: type II secretion system protein GspG [Candidatus Scalindua sp. SCAELEC01]TDE65487.1 MAG: type II secretion system protein GspG [Candidatus Scalindua sp. AMX11]GJQ59324.1 MAG: type II secretion system protein GspG [Candidatus Scalindua sp.]
MVKNRRKIKYCFALIVIGILGYIYLIIAPNLMSTCYLTSHKYSASKAQIGMFSTAIDRYKLDTGRYPSSELGLTALIIKPDIEASWCGPYLKKSVTPKDPWGREYIYTYPGEHGNYDIVSYGADGVNGGTGDNEDIVNW